MTITKTLNSYYKNPDQVAHKVLADKLGNRDPGNKPQTNDHIPYIYIKVDEKKDKRYYREIRQKIRNMQLITSLNLIMNIILQIRL